MSVAAGKIKQRDAEIVARLRSGETLRDIAADYGISYQRVQQIGRKAGIPPRKPQTGENNPRWKGGRKRTSKGYILAYCPGHPRANSRHRVPEHILMAESRIGRLLADDEIVHHINGRRDDNRPENLRVMTQAEHACLHHRRHEPELLIAWLRWLAMRLGHTPRLRDLAGRLPVSHVVFYYHFKSWREACRHAGLTPNFLGSGKPPRPLPPGFRSRHADIRAHATPESVAEAFGGLLTEHERHIQMRGAA